MTVSSQIIEVLDAICQKFGIVIDWSADTIIPYVTELVQKIAKFSIGKNIFYISINVFLIILGIWLIRKAIVDSNKLGYEIEGFMYCSGAICIIVALIWGSVSVVALIKAITLPELVAFEYVKDLWKSGVFKFS